MICPMMRDFKSSLKITTFDMKKRVILIFILFSFIGKGLDYFINDADKTHSQMLWSFLFLSHLGRSEYKRRQNIYFSMCTKQKVRLNNQFKSFFYNWKTCCFLRFLSICKLLMTTSCSTKTSVHRQN